MRLIPQLIPLLLASFLTAALAQEPALLWPQSVGGAPNENNENGKEFPPEQAIDRDNNGIIRISNVTAPTLQVFAPKEEKGKKPNGTCILIAPGGGYNILASTHEGTMVAEWLNSLGITAVILKYRVPRRPHREKHAAPLEDAQRAIRMIRANAENWNINPNRVGMLGFSAGGHLTATAGTTFDKPLTKGVPSDETLDKFSCRPDFLVLIYAAYLLDKEGSFAPEINITKDTPPSFLVVTHDDADRGRAAALFYAECQKQGVDSELHVFLKGGHGYGMFKREGPVHNWPNLCADWLDQRGLLEK